MVFQEPFISKLIDVEGELNGLMIYREVIRFQRF